MMEMFLVWFEDEFFPWLEKAMKRLAIIVCVTVTIPFWLLPFLWWFFAVRKKGGNEEGADQGRH